jgi:hypothetical protein
MQPFSPGKGPVIVCLIVGIVFGCEALLTAQMSEPAGSMPASEMAYFYMRERTNYAGAQWVYDDRTDKLVGYAPWDPIRRRWTLFSRDGKYKGFIQATIGDDGFEYSRLDKEFRNNLQFGVRNVRPANFRQYLWYDSHNRYRGLFVKRLGGRSITETLPEGELGGQLGYYVRGDIQSESPLYKKEVDPLKQMMEGIEVNPIDPRYKEQPTP